MAIREGYKFVAGGNITPSRFVALNTSYDSTVDNASAANQRCLGVSQTGTRKAPGTGADDGYAAIVGEPVQVFLPGDVAPIMCGSGGVTRGQLIKTDASGKAIASATTGQVLQWVHALALESGADGEIVNFLVLHPTPYSPAVS